MAEHVGMLSVPAGAKCTCTFAVTGELCGKPAVAGFAVGSRHYYECEEHAARPPADERSSEDG